MRKTLREDLSTTKERLTVKVYKRKVQERRLIVQ